MSDLSLDDIFGPQGLLASGLPDFEYRGGQLQMARAVERALLADEVLLAEAGTGTGKTLAYLIPALLSGRKAVVATGTKTLQEQLFFKDIPLLHDLLPAPFTASLMKGRGNYLCRRSLRRALAERHSRLERRALLAIQRWSGVSERGDRAELDFLTDPDPLWDDIAAWSESCVGGECEDFAECFLTRMRQEAAAADLVIVNHHLLLADAVVRDAGGFQVIPAYSALILDEAHLLEDVATDFFGAEIGNLRVERLVRDTLREWKSLAQADRSVAEEVERVGAAAGRFFGAVRPPEGEGPRRFIPELFEGTAGGAGRELAQALAVLRDTIHALSGKPEGLLACARRANQQAAVLQQLLAPAPARPEEGGALPAVRWIEQRGRGTVLHISPLDIAPEFHRMVLEGAEAVVLTSATLSAAGGFDFIRARLGIDQAREFQSDSPFDYPHQAILYIPRHLPDPREAAFLEAAADEIRELLTLSQGRALVLFTSLAAMQATHRRLSGALPYPVMVQGESARSQLLERFRREVHSVLLATRSFWQGVDVVGESLSCLIVHKLPFAYPGDPVLEARLEFLAERGGDPFWEYQIPSAIISLRQGLGRLIRSGQDRGALCILDGRLHTRGYRHAFLESLPSCRLTADREAIRRFFEEA